MVMVCQDNGGKKMFCFDIDGRLKINSDHLYETIEFLNKNNITKIEIDKEFKLKTLDFLKKCKNIEEVYLNDDIEVQNFSELSQLSNLNTLYLSEQHHIDLSKIKKLEYLYLEGNNKNFNIDKCIHLKELYIWSYKPKSKNLVEFRDLAYLEKLIIIQGNINSLDGIAGLKLTKLELSYLRNLINIEALQGLSNTLTELEMENCKKIEGYEVLGNLKSVEWLKLVGCADIPNLSFIKQMPSLKKISFVDTNIVDGDLSPCVGLDFVGFMNKRHYSHKFEQLNPTRADWGMDEWEEEDVRKPESLAEMKEQNPTKRWEKSMEEGDELFTEENIMETRKVLGTYIDSLVSLKKPQEKEVVGSIKKIILELNAINEKYDYFIETMEREELCEFILEAANKVGYKAEEDITEEWREW